MFEGTIDVTCVRTPPFLYSVKPRVSPMATLKPSYTFFSFCSWELKKNQEAAYASAARACTVISSRTLTPFFSSTTVL